MKYESEYLKQLKQELPNFIVKLRDFDIKAEMGPTNSGTLFFAVEKTTNRNVIIRKISKNKESEDKLRRFNLEVRALARCNSICVNKLIGYTIFQPYSIITEYQPNRTVDTFIYSLNPCRKACIIGTSQTKIAIGIAWGLMHIHSKGIIHRDLCVNNILLDLDFVPKIIGFGIARFIDSLQSNPKKIEVTASTAPEVALGNEYGVQSEMYSYGILLYELSEMEKPFKDFSSQKIIDLVIKGGRRPEITNKTPENLKDFIEKCWSENPHRRPSIEEAFRDFSSHKIEFPLTDHAKIDEFVNTLREEQQFMEPINSSALEASDFIKSNLTDLIVGTDSSTFVDFTMNTDYVFDDTVILAENQKISPTINIPKPFDFKNDFMEMIEAFKSSNNYNLIENAFPLAQLIYENQDPDQINFILQTAIELIRVNKDYIYYLDCAGLFTCFQKITDEIADLVLKFYSYPFMLYPQIFTDKNSYFISELLLLRPQKVLFLYSHYVMNFESIENPWPVIDVLVISYKKLINDENSVYLLRILYFMLTKYPLYKEGRYNDAVPVFLDCMKSTNINVLREAYTGYINISNDFSNIDLQLLFRYFETDLWDLVISIFLRLNYDRYETYVPKIINETIFHCNESISCWTLLLNISKHAENHKIFVDNPSWMEYSDGYPSETLKLFLIIFKNQEFRQKLCESEYFPVFILGLVESQNDAHYKAIPSILTRIRLDSNIIPSLHENGVISQIIKRGIFSNNYEINKCCLICVDSLCRFNFYPEFTDMIHPLIQYLQYPQLFGYSVHIIVSLSYHREICRIFSAKGFENYFKRLKGTHEYENLCEIFLSNSKIANR